MVWYYPGVSTLRMSIVRLGGLHGLRAVWTCCCCFASRCWFRMDTEVRGWLCSSVSSMSRDDSIRGEARQSSQ